MEQDEQMEKNGEKTEMMTEESFLKDVYFFMKQRDTPIERIPHLGFKQINLYMMFKTVMELGGYHQVTSQQLWKKVYNILGGNPRSTSAATCTRRHYEKLLLPYEYHLAGYGDEIPITPTRHRKRFRYDDNYNLSSKRADFTHLHQFNQYIPPSPMSLPSYLAVSLSSVPTLSSPLHPQPVIPFIPPSPVETGTVKQPLEFLRHLAQEYNSSSGWTEPLNLSKKQDRVMMSSNTPSSFTPPTAKKKEPKFLNKAPPLHQGNQSGIGKASPSAQAVVNQMSRDESHVINLTSSCSSSPTLWKAPPSSTPPLPQRPNLFSTVQTKHPEPRSIQAPVAKSDSSNTSQPSSGPISPSFPLDPYGGMEIKIPLSLLQNWIKGGLILSPASNQQHLPRSKPNETPSSPERKISEAPANLSFDHQADLSLKNQVRNLNKSDISMDANKSANKRQAPEKKLFVNVKHSQTSEPAKVTFYNPVSQLNSPQGGFQERETCTNQVPSASLRIPDQPGLKSPGHGKDSAQIGAMNFGRASAKTMVGPPLAKVNSTSAPFVQLTPEYLKSLLSSSPFRLEKGKIC